MVDRQARACNGASVRSYREQAWRFLQAYGGKDIAEFTQSDIKHYLAYINGLDSIASGTKVSNIRTFKIFLQWVADEFQVSYNPKKIKIPKMPKKSPPIYTADDFMAILEAVKNSEPWIQLRDIACIAVFFDTGIRRAELVGIKRAEFLRCGEILTVTGKGNKARKVRVGDTARAYVMAFLEACPFESEYLFPDRYGRYWTPQAVSRMMYRLGQKLPFKLTAHLFRHNFATHFYLDAMEDGRQVDPTVLQTLMGHSSRQTTDRYLHQAMEEFAALSAPSHLDRLCKK